MNAAWHTVIQFQEKWYPLKSLFSVYPPEHWKFMWAYVALIGICFLAAIALIFLKKIHPSLRSRLSNLAWTNVLLGIMLFFFRFERIPLLGMDLWRLVQEVSILAWLASIWYYWRHGFRAERLADQVVAYKEKYLPRPKKK